MLQPGGYFFSDDRTERFMVRIVFALNCLLCFLYPTVASAWGYQGHEVVGSIADNLLNANAKRQVADILKIAKPELRTAGPWADCVKSVIRHDDLTFHYEVDPNHLEFEVPCTSFNSSEERARMVDYAKRNWDTCSYTPDGFERGCHNTFHFDDIAVQRNGFDRNFQGQNSHDLVAAIGAAIAVLSDKPMAPPFPFSIKDKKEALLLLAHFIGDLHQPLHVGAVYLDANGKRVDPDTAHQIDPATETIGGNAIQDQNLSLHHEWDDIPTDIGEAATSELLWDAKSVPASQGRIEDWPAAWASDSILVAHDAFAGLTFKLTPPPAKLKWTVAFDDHVTYLRSMDAIKRKQLAKGGARLAALLNAIWP
jgi:S1/P1 Nuclease